MVINPDQITGHDGTLDSVMSLRTTRSGTVVCDIWQSVYFGLLRDQSLGVVDDEEPGVEDLGAR